MNLIEQLGGYEIAKEKYQALSDSDMITIGPVEFSAKDYFEDELLEYRRQHNIFEVGDDVVYEGEAGLEAVFQIETLTKKGKPKTVKTKRFGNFPCRYCTVRHATDAEIQAGKRL